MSDAMDVTPAIFELGLRNNAAEAVIRAFAAEHALVDIASGLVLGLVPGGSLAAIAGQLAYSAVRIYPAIVQKLAVIYGAEPDAWRRERRRLQMAPHPPVGQAQDQGSNIWDFLIVVVVVIALLVLVIVLVTAYKNRPGTIATILGIVVPVFAAVFGYAGGSTAGKITGKQLGRQEVKARVLPQITALRQQAAGVMTNVRMHAVNPADSDRWLLQTDFTHNHADLGSRQDLDLAGQIENLENYVQGL